MESLDVDTFKTHLGSGSSSVQFVGDYKERTVGYVFVEYGLNDVGDFAWHFSSYHRAKLFPANLEMLLRIIKTYLSKVIPDNIHVEVYLPPQAWEKKTISVMARGIGKTWNFDAERLQSPIDDICNLMTAEINKHSPKRTRL